MRPLVAALSFLHSLLDIVKQEPDDDEPATPAENIEALITAGTEEGLIEEDDRKLIQSVVAFGDKVVREVMTPRPNMVAIQADETLEALHELVVNEQYSRIPVYQTSIDDIVGFVHVRDMFEVAESSRQTRTVRELMRPIRFVPETKPVDDLMREMQQEGAHMVIVIDEYGNTAGLATMEDLLEVILGEIRDEHEPDSDVNEDGHGGYIVSGNFDLARVSDMLDFHPEEEVESTTIGGLVMEWLGRVPKPGEAIERDGIRVEVLASDDLRVEQVRLCKPLPEAAHARPPQRLEEHAAKAHRSGFVTILGRPNAGKSTLLNALVGQKVAIVADKPQTTRTAIQGVMTTPEAQVIFLDTPGIHRSDSAINKRMMDAVRASLEERDLLIFVVDATQPFEERRARAEHAARDGPPVIWRFSIRSISCAPNTIFCP